jgi:hypothetical protein
MLESAMKDSMATLRLLTVSVVASNTVLIGSKLVSRQFASHASVKLKMEMICMISPLRICCRLLK